MSTLNADAIVNQQNLETIGRRLGLRRVEGETPHDFASRCHYQVDAMLREHAHLTGDGRVVELMDVHDAIEHCFADTMH